jgi:hypothetical protein
MEQYRRGSLTFDVIDAGPADRPVVVLLRGFPQFNTSWSKVIPRLTAHGYHWLAPNQRDYSPGALTAALNWYRAMPLSDVAQHKYQDQRPDAVRVELRRHSRAQQGGSQLRPLCERRISLRDPATSVPLDTRRTA